MLHPIEKIAEVLAKVKKGLEMEHEISEELHGQVQAIIRRLEREDDGLHERLDKAAGYAVFPAVGRASAALGASFGLGEVYGRGHLTGYAGIVQLSLGVQLGGATFTEFLIFESHDALHRFKEGKLQLAANASAVAVKAGVAVTNDKKGTEIRLYSKGGFQIEADIAGQKFIYKPAALSRVKRIEHADSHAK